MASRRKLWPRLVAGVLAGGALGLIIGQLAMPWPAIFLCLVVVAFSVWAIREQIEMRKMKRQIEEWQRQLDGYIEHG